MTSLTTPSSASTYLRRTPYLALAVLCVGWAGIGLAILANAATYPHPDEFYAMRALNIHGWIGASLHYWQDLLGRLTAPLFFFFQYRVLKQFGLSFWEITLVVRAFNFVYIALAFAYVLRSFAPAISRLWSLGLGALLSTTVLTQLGLQTIVGYWSLDQSIYSLSILAICMLFGAILRERDGRASILARLSMPFWLFVALHAHEVNFVFCGLLLAGCYIDRVRELRRPAPWLDAALIVGARLRALDGATPRLGVAVTAGGEVAFAIGRREARLFLRATETAAGTLLRLGAIYVFSIWLLAAYAGQAIAFRAGVWPSSMGYFDAAIGALPVVEGIVWEILGVAGNAALVVGMMLVGVAMAWDGAANPVRFRLPAIAFIAALLALTWVVSALILQGGQANQDSLSLPGRLGTLQWLWPSQFQLIADSKFVLPQRHNHYLINLSAVASICAVMVFAGLPPVARFVRARAGAIVGVGFSLIALHVLATGRMFEIADWATTKGVDRLATYKALDRQLRETRAVDGNLYVDELDDYMAAPEQGLLQRHFIVDDIAEVYGRRPATMVPCEVVSGPESCDPARRFTRVRKFPSRDAGDLWDFERAGVVPGLPALVGDRAGIQGVHGLTSHPIEFSARSAIRVTATVEDVGAGGFAIVVDTPKGRASAHYTYADGALRLSDRQGDLWPLDVRAIRRTGATIMVQALFVRAGPAEPGTLTLAVQDGASRALSFAGTGANKVRIHRLDVRLVDSGPESPALAGVPARRSAP